MYCTKEIRSCIFATVLQLRSRDIILSQQIFPFDKLINQQEEILAYEVINGTCLLGDILTDRHELDQYQLRNYENLRTALHSTTHSQLLTHYELSKLGMVFLVICVTHHPSPVLGIN